MNELALITIVPLLAATLSMIEFKPALMRALVSLLLWAQLAILAAIFAPVISGNQDFHMLYPGFAVDRIGALFAMLTTLVVAASITHAAGFFQREEDVEQKSNYKQQVFYASACLFLIAMTSVCICDNLGYLWISIEGTTLASAPLVYYSRNKHALEATWKYLIICSVGIAFALFGTILIFASGQNGSERTGTLLVSELIKSASGLDYSLLRLGFVFCLLGYGTKAGIFPLHSWLPDAHSEAPAPASAMLSGGLLNCALLAIWRLVQIVLASGHPVLALKMPLVMGVLTVIAASFFLVRQSGLKRLWAYSSIENVGLMLSAIGLGSAPLFFLLALNHSLAKVSIFLLCGNIIQSTGTKHLHDIKGILVTSPAWAILLALSAFAVTGAPPFGAFVSEWFLLTQSADASLWWVVIGLVFALALTFVVVCVHVARCLWGTPPPSIRVLDQLSGSLVPAILLASTLIVGVTSVSQYLVNLL